MPLILGGGIAGLICAKYLDGDYAVVEKREPRLPSPFLLWNTPESRELIEKLNLPVKIKTIKIGHFYKGEFVSPTDQLRKIYSDKVGRESSMTDGKTELEVVDIDSAEFLGKLKEGIEIINDEILEIKGKKLVGKEGVYPYDSLISTIPLPELGRILGMKTDLYSSPTSFVTAKSDEKFIWDNDYEYIYLLDENNPFYRVAKKERPVCVFESLVPTIGLNVEVIKIETKKYGKVLGGVMPDLSNYRIKLLGRFSEWDSTIRAHDVIRTVKSWMN